MIYHCIRCHATHSPHRLNGRATGATGRRLVEDLVRSEHCNQVIALTRREIPVLHDAFPELDLQKAEGKLVLRLVDYEAELQPQLSDSIPKELPVLSFCALGSTGAEKEKVDVVYAGNFARAVKGRSAAVAVVSSMGANSASSLDYFRIIGTREDEYSSAFAGKPLLLARPGALERQELAQSRMKERVLGSISWVVDHIDTRLVARAMVVAIERLASGSATTGEEHDEVFVVNNPEMRAIEPLWAQGK